MVSLASLAKKRSRPSSDRSFLCRDAARSTTTLSLATTPASAVNSIPEERVGRGVDLAERDIFSTPREEDELSELPYRARRSISSQQKLDSLPSLMSLSSFIRSDALSLSPTLSTFPTLPALSSSTTTTPTSSCAPSPITLEFGLDCQVFPVRVPAAKQVEGKRIQSAMKEQERVGFAVFSPRASGSVDGWGEAI